jgi:dTDP-4-amino-4,6-dideoxygalactose transaminase
VGATPVFVDIDKFYHLDVSQLKITDKLKAILFVDLYGQTPDIDKIKNFASKFNLHIIEDAAQSFGSSYKGKKVGNLVDLTCFSFNPLKNLAAMGDAGAVTGKKEYIKKIKAIRNHGRSDNKNTVSGYNFRIDNIQASILNIKLKKVDEWIKRKRHICKIYSNELSGVVKCPKENEYSYHTYYVYVIETPKGTRNNLKEYLKKQGIETKIHYENPTHLLPYIKNTINLPNTEYASSNILSLPNYYNLQENWQQHIIKSIKDFYVKEKI